MLGTGMLALPAAAHHSFAAQYDADQPVTLTGKVTKVEWMNPHMLFFIDVEDEKSGEVVTIEGSRARDGSPLANARSVILTSTGKKLFAGSSQNDER